MKDWKQVLMGLCKVKSIVTLLLTGTFMALALRGDVAAKDFYSVMVMVLTFYFGYQRNRIVPDRAANRLCGHLLQALLYGDLSGNFAVGHRLAVWNRQ